MNLKIREFALSLEKYVESAEIPWEAKKLILKEIYETAKEKADQAVLEEIEDRDAAEQENLSAKSSNGNAVCSESVG